MIIWSAGVQDKILRSKSGSNLGQKFVGADVLRLSGSLDTWGLNLDAGSIM